MEIFSIPPESLSSFMDRERKLDIPEYETYLHGILLSTLSELGDFIPAEGACVLLDQPGGAQKKRALTYVASFGQGTPQLIGRSTPSTSGVVGEVYTLGKSIVRNAEPNQQMSLDKLHFPLPLRNVIAEPLTIENSTIGALLVFNKKDPVGFTIRDLKLVKIFAGYISTSFQNAIDARKSRELSKRDDLTGLYNDRFFHHQIEIEMEKADEGRYPLSLLFLDLDQFKSINDKHGHLVGSATLREVGFILREAIDFERAIIARYGGDEYVAILPGLSLDQATETAERIRKMVHQKLFMISQADQDGSFISHKGIISCSIGVASLQDHVPKSKNIKDRKNMFIRLADQAMYLAKEKGKNRVCVGDPEIIANSKS